LPVKAGRYIGLTLLPPKNNDNEIEEDQEKLDWGEVYTELVCHTSMDFDQISERTIPQIRAIRLNLPKQMITNTFGFSIGGETEVKEDKPKQMQTVADRMAFAAKFNK